MRILLNGLNEMLLLRRHVYLLVGKLAVHCSPFKWQLLSSLDNRSLLLSGLGQSSVVHLAHVVVLLESLHVKLDRDRKRNNQKHFGNSNEFSKVVSGWSMRSNLIEI